MSQRTRAAKPNAANAAQQPDAGTGEQPAPTPAKPRAKRSTVAPTPTPAPAAEAAPVGPVSGEEIARMLRAMAGELERDPALARRVASAMEGAVPATAPPSPTVEQEARPAVSLRPVEDGGEREEGSAPPAVGRSFRPRLVTGLAPDLGPGVPNPFELRERLGEAGLRGALADLRLGTLRAIIREHQLDPKGRLKGLNDAEKLRKAILAATQR